MIVNGKPYGPLRFKQIVEECYLISKNCNTSYVDILNITPAERGYLREFIVEEAHRAEEAVNKIRSRDN